MKSRGKLVTKRSRGIAEDHLALPRKLQRHAQFMLDFVEAENSMGFHAPQEALRILGESIDYSRQGRLALRGAPVAGTPAAPKPAAKDSR